MAIDFAGDVAAIFTGGDFQGVTGAIATGQGGSFSVTLTATDLLQINVQKVGAEGLDGETCTLLLRGSAAPSVPHAGWLINVTSGNHQGKWQVATARTRAQGAYYALECRKGGIRGTPT
jgi:hypothetical protein